MMRGKETHESVQIKERCPLLLFLNRIFNFNSRNTICCLVDNCSPQHFYLLQDARKAADAAAARRAAAEAEVERLEEVQREALAEARRKAEEFDRIKGGFYWNLKQLQRLRGSAMCTPHAGRHKTRAVFHCIRHQR